MKKIWIDTDMGIDDCLAIIYAHNNPALEIVGISLSPGNVSLEQAITNYNYLSHVFELPYPVYVGSSAIEPFTSEDMTGILGKSGLGWIQPPQLKQQEIPNIPVTDTSVSFELLALAPPYNIPEVINKNKKSILKIHMLSGSLESANPEFNLQSAPISTDFCIQSGIPIVMYTQDLSEKLPLFCLHYNIRYADVFQKRFLETLMNWYDGKPLFDPIIPIAVANPQLFDLNEIGINVLNRPGFLCQGEATVNIADSTNEQKILDEFAKNTTKGIHYEGLNIISPHLDDAVLSIGGIMSKYAKTPLIIQNVFSKSRYLKKGYSEKEYVSSIREHEEKEVAKMLMAMNLLLGFDDWTLRGYVNWNANITDPAEYIQKVFCKINEQINPNFRTVLPLGVGRCIDHQILREYPSINAVYYEDMPYAAYPELFRRMGDLQPNLIKISRFMNTKRMLMGQYKSQLTKEDEALIRDYSLHKNGESYETIWS